MNFRENVILLAGKLRRPEDQVNYLQKNRIFPTSFNCPACDIVFERVKKFQIMFGVGVFLMSQSQEWNFSFWQEDRDALIAYFFVAYFLTHQQFINEVSLTLADGYFKTSKEKKTCQTTVLYHGIFRCPFFTSGVVCFWWFYLLWW